MYATKAFALKKIIRKILVESFLEYQANKKELQESLDVTTNDGEVLTDFHQWAAALEYQFRRLHDNQADIQNQIDLRQTITGSSFNQVADAGEENG